MNQLKKFSPEDIQREFINACNVIPTRAIIKVIKETLEKLSNLNQEQSGLSEDLDLSGEVQSVFHFNARFAFNARVKIILNSEEEFTLVPTETKMKMIAN